MRRRGASLPAWDDPAALAVPVHRVKVSLVLADGTRRSGEVFTADGDTVESTLASPRWFLPVAEGARVCLYALRAVACATVPAPAPTELESIGEVRRSVCVELRSGVKLAGELRYCPPPEQSRTADHLNDDEPLFRLYDGDDVHYVAKAHVQHVIEREEA